MNNTKKNLISVVDTVVFEIDRVLKRKNPMLVAFDGRSGMGKSTIAQMVASRIK